jgi:hypothetical protein
VGKPDKKKGPKTLIERPAAGKMPRAELDEDWREMRPAWRVSLLVMQTPFGWKELEHDAAITLRERLASYESMKWKEIVLSYRSHIVKPTDLCREAQEHLAAIEQDDIDSLVSLGITQKSRVFGILEHNVLKVLWWDPEHEVWPMEKPNT